ncbi:mitochondrial large ribosomal subunit L49, putative [Rhizophagus clarus]|uniref:Large ribosomal subunit protein mL49 n=1 Tax=Rhizophagus clarus TaxID=94130 RepID=A0A8H3QGB8_9GLOM|nr:mitochondrial large ribosomal subunit L49, putative [Rhizophagus clarus]
MLQNSTTSLISRFIPISFTRFIHSKSTTNSLKHKKSALEVKQNSALKQTQTSQQQQLTKYVRYPYFVARTRMKELPVYVDVKNGRTRILTEISRIEGDSEALCDDIRNELFYWSQEKNLIRVNHTNNHIFKTQ